MIAKAKLLLLIMSVAGAFWGGWWVNGNRIEANALDQYKEALKATQSEYNKVLSKQHSLYETEVQKSLTLEQQNASLRETVGVLREEIDHVSFTPEIRDGCRVHPVSGVDFRMLYDKAARGGNPESGEGDPGRVSPRDD